MQMPLTLTGGKNPPDGFKGKGESNSIYLRLSDHRELIHTRSSSLTKNLRAWETFTLIKNSTQAVNYLCQQIMWQIWSKI